jgi:amino-acid N-acetyltransferase
VLSHDLAEIRSLVVADGWRGTGVSTQIVDELKRRARAGGYTRLCAFTHRPAAFVGRGFSIVPHVWLPEKIATDCHACAWFRQCGQYAMLLTLDAQTDWRETAARPAPLYA